MGMWDELKYDVEMTKFCDNMCNCVAINFMWN